MTPQRREHEKALSQAIARAIKGTDQAMASQLAAHIAEQAGRVAATQRPPHLTMGAFRDEAIALADACAGLERRLSGSTILPSLPVIGCVVNGAAGLDEDGHARLRELLALLRADLRAAVAATDGDPRNPQLDLPTRGDRPDDARRVASYVVGELYRRGGRISAAAETSPAVECVRAVFALLGVEAGARHHVAEWLKRHPEAPPAKP